MSTKTTNALRPREAGHRHEAVKPTAPRSVGLTPANDLAALQRTLADPSQVQPADILVLQRTVGNRAVSRLIQTKLTVGPAGDRYEQEADRVAQQVMTMPAPVTAQAQSPVQRVEEEEELQMKPVVQRVPEEEEDLQLKPLAAPLAASITPLVQRHTDEEVQPKLIVQRAEEEELQTKPIVQRALEEEEEIQAKPQIQRATSDAGFEVSGEFEQQLSASRGGGSPLPAQVRAFMEPRFGADFSGVRIHTGGQSAQLNRSVSAQAFTRGQDIYLGEGKDDITSSAGKELLAHELTHTIQQGAALRVQRVEEDELQMKPLAAPLAASITPLVQRAPEEEEELQAKLMIQRRIDTTQEDVLEQQKQPPTLQDQAYNTKINDVATHLEHYNAIEANHSLSDADRIQQQFDELRLLDRAIYGAIDALSTTAFEIKGDPHVEFLHNLLQKTEAEHQQLVTRVAQDEDLRDEVDPFDINQTGQDPDDLTQEDARGLWKSLVAGTGKLKLVGPLEYQTRIKSWLTKLMDTKQGRRLLRYLNSGDPTELGTNVYIGEKLAELPPEVRVVPNASTDLKDAGESVAQPLLGVDTKTTRSQVPLVNPTPVTNANEYNDAVLNGGRGVSMGGNDYAFGQSSGSFVNITDPGKMRLAAGVDRPNLNGVNETPEVYQPDWVLLGHELGHSANMKAGATTEGKKQQDNPTDVFAQQFSGIDDRDTRQNQWYGGSEEYINIVGNENRLRAQGGVSERGAHTGASGREMQRREPAIHAAFAENVWGRLFEPGSPTEVVRQQQYSTQKRDILTAFVKTPRDPQHLIDATNLGQATTNFFQQRAGARTITRVSINAVLNGDAARNALDANRRYEATLQAQYDHVKNSLLTEIIETPTEQSGIVKAQRIVLFCQAWLALRTAHDAAGWGKQFKYKAWWDKATRSVRNIGVAIVQGDNARYIRKMKRVRELRADYTG